MTPWHGRSTSIVDTYCDEKNGMVLLFIFESIRLVDESVVLFDGRAVESSHLQPHTRTNFRDGLPADAPRSRLACCPFRANKQNHPAHLCEE